MKSKKKNEHLKRIAEVIDLYIAEEGMGTAEDWHDIIAETLSVTDKRSSLGWMRLAKVNEMIQIVGEGRNVFWKRGRTFEKYRDPFPDEPAA